MNAQLKKLATHFAAIEREVPLHPIRTAAEYDAAVAALNRLLDAGAGDERHALANLAATLGELIGNWDGIAEETPALALSVEDLAELQRSQAAHRANPASGIPWEQARAELFKSRG